MRSSPTWSGLGCPSGGTTADGEFTWEHTVECLGACGGAPAMQVDHHFQENLTPERVDAILDGLRAAAARTPRGSAGEIPIRRRPAGLAGRAGSGRRRVRRPTPTRCRSTSPLRRPTRQGRRAGPAAGRPRRGGPGGVRAREWLTADERAPVADGRAPAADQGLRDRRPPDPRGLRALRRLRGAAQGPAHPDPRRGGRRGQDQRHPGPWRRRLPHRDEVVLPAQGRPPPLPLRQRRRVRSRAASRTGR